MTRSTMQVAFQGEMASYSHEACERYFGAEVAVKPCRTLREVFNFVETGRQAFGVVPVENSYEGSINETHDLLAATRSKVCGEIQVRVRHCLIAKTGVKLRDLEWVYSHPQALAQCSNYLRRHQLEGVPTYDTAGSVRLIKMMRSRKVGAIASKRSAVLYSMKIISEGIEDSDVNYTRFLVLGKKIASATGNDKTAIIFRVRHTPGSLCRALHPFSTRRINLTRIESRPVKNKPWEYNFYVDFAGHTDDEICRRALRELRGRCAFVRVLGSFPAAMA